MGVYSPLVKLPLKNGIRAGGTETGIGSHRNTAGVECKEVLWLVRRDAGVSERLETITGSKNTLGDFWGAEDHTVDSVIQHEPASTNDRLSRVISKLGLNIVVDKRSCLRQLANARDCQLKTKYRLNVA